MKFDSVEFEVIGVSAKDKFNTFFPVLELKRAGAAGMVAEVCAIVVGDFVRDDTAVVHCKEGKHGRERFVESDDEGRIVGRLKTIGCNMGENPTSGRGYVRVNDAVERVAEVICNDSTGRIGGME